MKNFKYIKICNGKHECQFKLTLAEYGSRWNKKYSSSFLKSFQWRKIAQFFLEGESPSLTKNRTNWKKWWKMTKEKGTCSTVSFFKRRKSYSNGVSWKNNYSTRCAKTWMNLGTEAVFALYFIFIYTQRKKTWMKDTMKAYFC